MKKAPPRLDNTDKIFTMANLRGVAQLGSALAWGVRGRRFKSFRPDHINQRVTALRCNPFFIKL